MKLHVINSGHFKLDGGAMFGVVPKTIWSKNYPADELNLCPLAMRCLLIEQGSRLILVDTGIGDKQSEKFLSYYYLHGDDTLVKSIRSAGFKPEDITDVFLTHLHLDHVGGAVNNKGVPTFKNATYWTNEEHWNWAMKPNLREGASFLKENLIPLQESGQLKFVKRGKSPFKDIKIRYSNGHTQAMMMLMIPYQERMVAYVADLFPTSAHIPIAYVTGYDVHPLKCMKEKEQFLKEALENEYILFFEHDHQIECATLIDTEKGIRLGETLKLQEL